jgi:CRISPR/Cas system-associated exonuclease Cas4 (RecB family)
VDLFALCPRRYYLARYLGWRGGASHGKAAGPSAAEFGTQVHALLAGAPAEGASPEALALVSRFESSELARRAARARRVEREFDFVMALEDVVLRGQIDLWFEEGGELILVDYKTDDVEPEEAVARADSYALQLRLYALALERCAGRLPDRAYVYLLRPDVAVPIALSAPLVADAGDVVRAMRKAQSEMKFELQDGDHCLRCPFYRGLCPAILLSKAVMRRECNSLGSGSGSRPL